MPTRITPNINVSGIFSLVAPWVATAGKIYTVEAIRSFEDISKQGKDVFSTYYSPMGLVKLSTSTSTNPNAIDFEAEIGADVHIITLKGSDGSYIYVPDSYIAGYPVEDSIPYNHFVLSLSLGALPRDYDPSAIEDEVAEMIRYRFGIQTPVVKAVSVQSNIAVTPDEHDALTNARVGATNVTRSSQGENIALQQQINNLTTINGLLTDVLKRNGLLGT